MANAAVDKLYQCSSCKEGKPGAAFPKRHDGRRDGADYVCYDCARKQRAELRKLDPERVRRYSRESYARHRIAAATKRQRPEWKAQARGYSLKANYGISLKDYERMFAEQQGRCLICDRHCSQIGGKGLVVDHDHNTGQVRGLLCTRCNSGLGNFNDDPLLLAKALSHVRMEVSHS